MSARPLHTPPSEEDPWALATFAGAARLRDERARALTLHERFQWLDEMLALGRFRQAEGDRRPIEDPKAAN